MRVMEDNYRKKMQLGQDGNALVQLAYEGATVPTWGIWPFYDANQPYFDAIQDLRTQYPSDQFSLDQTNSLLSGAGLSPGDITLKYVVNSETNEDKRADLLIQAQSTIVEDQPWVIFYSPNTTMVLNSRVGGYALTPLWIWSSWAADLSGTQ